MKKRFVKFLSVFLAATVCLCVVGSSFRPAALTKAELRDKIGKLEQQSKAKESEIAKLKTQANKQQELKSAIEQKISLVQQQINLCNNEISKINSRIAANKAKIAAKEAEIEADKLAFKKRLRAIYMSNTGSQVQVLLGADDFAQYLQLAQLTSSVSARDKLLIEKIVAAIELLNEKQKENESLLGEQVSIKKTLASKQQELQAENSQIQSVINSLNSDRNDLASENADIEKQIKAYQRILASMTSTYGTSFVYDGGQFLWPISGYYSISAGFQSNDSVHHGHHNGIDIAGGGISGKPILAIADGVVTKASNICTHNYGKSRSCGCNSGYGNYVSINHGTGPDGNTYVATYAHMSSTTVSTGATVRKGQVIGYVGSTGWSTGYHLHFGIAVNGSWRNPFNYYRRVQ